MRLLLDTHVAIWWDMGAPISAQARRAIRDADEVFVSAVAQATQEQLVLVTRDDMITRYPVATLRA